MQVCPFCKTELPPGTNVCPGCETELQDLEGSGGRADDSHLSVEVPVAARKVKSPDALSVEVPPTARVKKPPEALSLEVPAAARVQTPPGNLTVEVPSAARSKKPPEDLSVEVPAAARPKTPPANLSVEVPVAARPKTPPSNLSVEVPAAARPKTPQSNLSVEVPAAARPKTPQSNLSVEVPAGARVKKPRKDLSLEVPAAARAKTASRDLPPVILAPEVDVNRNRPSPAVAGHISDHPPPAGDVLESSSDLDVRLRAEDVLDGGGDPFADDPLLAEDDPQAGESELDDSTEEADESESFEEELDSDGAREEEAASFQQEVSAVAVLDDDEILVGMGRLDSPKPKKVEKGDEKPAESSATTTEEDRLPTTSLAEDMHGSGSIQEDASERLEISSLAEDMHGSGSMMEAADVDTSHRIETMSLAEDMHGAQSPVGDSEVERDSRGQLWHSDWDDRGSEIELAISRNAPPPTGMAPKERLVKGDDLDPDELEKKFTRLKPSDKSLDAPELGAFPYVPRLVEAIPKRGDTPFHWSVYWLRTRGIVKQQKEALRELGGALAKVKREEVRCVTALGHAARSQGMLPDRVRNIADAAEHVESAAAQRRERADLKYEERREAKLEQEATRKAGEAKLAKLEERHAPLAARYKEMRRRLAGAESTIRELTKMEKERRALLDKPPTEEELEGDIQLVNDRIVVTRRSAEELIKNRKKAHKECVASLKATKKQHKKLRVDLGKSARTLKAIEADMAKVRAVTRKVSAKVTVAENQAKAAEVSSKRQREHADRSAAEFDAEVGVAMLLESHPNPLFANLYRVVVKSKKQVAEVEKAYNKQQDHLESYDEPTARNGKRFAIGGFSFLFLATFIFVIVKYVINASAS